jgi:RimJ/RimL family protein N-acetyltransferase
MNAFPQPYTEAHGLERLRKVRELPLLEGLVVEVDGEFAGGIGCHRKTDVHELSASLGYWLAEHLWGKGIASEMVKVFTDHLFQITDLLRIEALVYEPNIASARVLEKAGFVQEARCRKAIHKQGRIMDAFLYARIR